MQFIQLDENNRVVAWAEFDSNPDPATWHESPWDEVPEDFDDWIYDGDSLTYSYRDLPPVPYTAEQALTAIFSAQPEMLDTISDDALMHMAPYMSEWETDRAYVVGDKVQYQDRPYRCLQSHTSMQEWNPVDATSLWARIIASEDPDNPLPWEQPDSTNPYMRGDRVTHNGHTWESDVDNNVWEPGVYGWTVVDE